MIDNSYYESLGSSWWDPKGPMGLLLRMNPVRYEYFRSVLPNLQGMRILDVGCGGGFLSEAFASQGAEVHGLDLSPNSVRAAQKHAAAQGLPLDIVVGRGEGLPYRSEAFDAVVAADLLEHLEKPESAIGEAARVLRPGGILLYETVNRTFFSRLAVIWFLEGLARKVPEHTHRWRMFLRPCELVSMLHLYGLRNQELRGLQLRGGIGGFLGRWISRRDPWQFAIGADTRASYVGYAVKLDDAVSVHRGGGGSCDSCDAQNDRTGA